ncbi:MAG TPA: class I SAM-dependent methyltransferase [Thermoanaerobaculia bacterium]
MLAAAATAETAEETADTDAAGAAAGRAAFYDRLYARLDSTPHLEVRREVFGEDLGQSGWATGGEARAGYRALGLAAGDEVLEVACGAGGLALLLAREHEARVTGVDASEEGIAAAARQARRSGLAGRARFRVADAAGPLPFADASFDGLVCWDSIDHLPRRERRLGDWHRVLRPGGRLLFTDPAVVTGPLTDEEVAVLAAGGPLLLVPPGVDELLLEEIGFDAEVSDRTAAVAGLAARWHEARARRMPRLLALEGAGPFERRQRQLALAHRLAYQQRLSRLVFVARKAR